MRTDLHTALKTEVAKDFFEAGIQFKQITLRRGKQDVVESLHARPTSYTTSGVQSTDLLSLLGFSRSGCPFHRGECYCRAIPTDFDVVPFAKAFGTALTRFDEASKKLQSCGITVPQPEGWGFFYGKPSEGRRLSFGIGDEGDGHTAAKCERMKESEDNFFRFVFAWIDNGRRKGWTTHYRAKHMPVASEFGAALTFLGGFAWFSQCPEFDFDGCWWRFFPLRGDDDDSAQGWTRNERLVEAAHRNFDSHTDNFSAGLKQLLSAHAILVPFSITFLPSLVPSPSPPTPSRSNAVVSAASRPAVPTLPDGLPDRFDVALSFAGTERPLAEELARRIRDAGFVVFYDDHYPEQLWGKNLADRFDAIYRKQSRFCVMFVSAEYASRMWTEHERKSAQARALEERGNEYILPIRVDDTELPGLLPTTGYLSLDRYGIERIAEMLVEKLRRALKR